MNYMNSVSTAPGDTSKVVMNAATLIVQDPGTHSITVSLVQDGTGTIVSVSFAAGKTPSK